LIKYQKIVGFADPSSLPTNPGWPLRNLLVLLQRRWNIHKIKVLCYREIPGRNDISQTCILTVETSDVSTIPGIKFYNSQNFKFTIILSYSNC